MRMLGPLIPVARTRFGRTVRPQVDRSFYRTPQWRRLRGRVIREAGGRCQWQGCGRSEPGMHCDHIVEIKDGGAPLERANLWCLCHAHHNAKTASEKKHRG